MMFFVLSLLGIFNQRTGDVSDQNLTEFTPAGKKFNCEKYHFFRTNEIYFFSSGWTFSIWGVIYFWQGAWLIYAISRIPRKSNSGYLYISPNTLHYTVFISYVLNLALNIAWLIIWDRAHYGVSIFR